MRRSQSAQTPVGARPQRSFSVDEDDTHLIRVRRQRSSSVDNDDDNEDDHSARVRVRRHQSSSVEKDDEDDDDTHSTAERSSDVEKEKINKFRGAVEEDDESTQGDAIEDQFEKRAISCLRYFVLFLMVAFTIAAGITSYKFLRREEQKKFINEVRHQSPHVMFVINGSFVAPTL
jgi:hypothetical protein